jgi:tetratricopeptide (TPR) repeat protein
MTLRSPFRRQQLLFVLAGALAVLLGAPRAQAQIDATITYKNNTQQAAKIVGVSGGSLMVKGQYGEEGKPLAQILAVTTATTPPEVNAAQQAFEAKDFAKAMTAAQAVVNKYRGMPAEWVVSMVALIGDIHLAQGDTAKAEAAYNEFAKTFPGHGGADLGRARVAVSKKDFAAARKIAEPLAEKAAKEKNVTRQAGQIYGQTFLVLGQVKEAQGEYAAALQDYLRTVTLYFHDRTAVAQAQERADALRKERHVFVP